MTIDNLKVIFIPREEPFTCEHCGAKVQPLGKGTYRDHCPKCLFSKHVDRDGPGDRLSDCLGLIEPVSIDQDGEKGVGIMYKCLKCNKVYRKRGADDDDLVNFLKAKAKSE